jgi:hypothetical protein
MSKARLVIAAVRVEKRPVSEVARAYGVARSWACALLARRQDEGEAAFEPRSRRSKTSPTAISNEAADLIERLRKELAGQGLDAGPQTIAWHLEQHHQLTVSAATVSRYLARAGLVTPDPAKRPKSSRIRFEADMPNECWQSGFTHYPLAGGTGNEILTWPGDHSRYVLSSPPATGSPGPPCCRHSVEHARSTASRPPPSPATAWSSPPGCPAAKAAATPSSTHCAASASPRRTASRTTPDPGQGRALPAMKNWLRAQPHQPATLAELQSLLDTFTGLCNTRRPHRSLPGRATPAAAYAARPKAGPGDRSADTHDRVRTDRIDATGLLTLRHNGKLHHIGTGRAHAGTRVLLLVQDLDIRVSNAGTGELIRELVLNPDKNYQPTGRPSGWPKKTPRPLRRFAASSMS